MCVPDDGVGQLTCCFRSAEKRSWNCLACVCIVIDVKVEITTKKKLTGCRIQLL